MFILKNLVNKILQGDKRSAAKAISIIENNLPEKNQILDILYKYTGKARVVGITGPPGAGKSTLVDGLIKEIRKAELKVGVIAVDPSSPFTGGAILGDRVRMQRHATDPGVFIRSMGSRGTLGGLARATKEAIKILDAMGLDVILIETVGVGQSELEIINIADSTVVVLHPDTGDSIQAFKAGIMEIADIFVVNKSDLSNSQKIINELEMLLDITKQNDDWKPPIVKTSSVEKYGINCLWKNIMTHFDFINELGIIDKKRTSNLEKEISLILHDMYQNKLDQFFKTDDYTQFRELLRRKEISPIQLADSIFKKVTLNK